MTRQIEHSRYRCRLMAVPVTFDSTPRDAWLRRAAAMAVFRGSESWLPRDVAASGRLDKRKFS